MISRSLNRDGTQVPRVEQLFSFQLWYVSEMQVAVWDPVATAPGYDCALVREKPQAQPAIHNFKEFSVSSTRSVG